MCTMVTSILLSMVNTMPLTDSMQVVGQQICRGMVSCIKVLKEDMQVVGLALEPHCIFVITIRVTSNCTSN